MGPDEQQHQRTQTTPGASSSDPALAAALAALTARIDTLERDLDELGNNPSTSKPTPPPPIPDRSAIQTTQPRTSLEDRIGSQLFSRIGIVALLIATALFLKWAIDNQWIGPVGRVLAGLIAGAAVILWSERFRRHSFPAFAYSLKAIGSGALYLSLWAAFQLYHLLPAPAALCAMAVVTAWNAFMAWSQNSELLAAYALTGALATPLLLSTGGNHEIFLFTYLLLIDIATVALIRLKSWPRLLVGAFPATVAYFIAWYIGWYNASSPNQPAAITILFLVLFFFTFVTPSFHTPLAGEPAYAPLPEVFLPLANAAFTALALYSVLHDAGYRDLPPWVAVILAAVYLTLMRLLPGRIKTPTTSAVHLALAVVFLTIAIPLKASGHWITIGWLAEGAALLWVSTRLHSEPKAQPRDPASRPTRLPELTANRTLRILALFALTLGFLGVLLQPLWLYQRMETPFLNPSFATALAGIAAFAISCAIALHARSRDNTANSPTWLTIAIASILALNLTAILACVRELETAFSTSAGNLDIDLQRSLAISAFLMLYSAVLLAIGFRKRSAFLRWQALILLVFTIGKAFLYDLRNLTQGYRVLSFLGLGALLMAISFAYQKDWLALRETHSGPFENPIPEAKPPVIPLDPDPLTQTTRKREAGQ
jgi:uncharacterized membrane protein